MPEGAQLYDDPVFFAGYSALRASGSGLNDVLEQPALRRLLPSLAALRLLDLGCGMGQFSRWAVAQGAASVVGLDASAKMLAVAREQDSERIVYRQADLDQFDDLPAAAFELAVSSLTLHYARDYPALLRRLARWLVPGGLFVYSIEHPIVTANKPTGWQRDAAGKTLHWAIDRYGDEGPRRETWFVEGVVKQHRTIASLLNGLIAAGFAIEALDEPAALPDAVAARPDLADDARRPPFLLVCARKRA
jgi:ubiquinone/menaquinone biosynthesis C-methylase UbiE